MPDRCGLPAAVFKIITPDSLLDEWAEVIVREHQRSAETAASVTAAVREFFADSKVPRTAYEPKQQGSSLPTSAASTALHCGASMCCFIEVGSRRVHLAGITNDTPPAAGSSTNTATPPDDTAPRLRPPTPWRVQLRRVRTRASPLRTGGQTAQMYFWHVHVTPESLASAGRSY